MYTLQYQFSDILMLMDLFTNHLLKVFYVPGTTNVRWWAYGSIKYDYSLNDLIV